MNFYGFNLHTNRALRILSFGLLLSCSSLPVMVSASSGIRVNGLKPDALESVRSVGQALLYAKRSFKSDQNTKVLRDSIKQTHQLVNELTQPLMTRQIQLTKPGQSTQSTGNARSKISPSDWHQSHATKILQLRTATGNLRSQCQTLRGKGNIQTSRSLYDSVVRFFTGKVNKNLTNHILTPVSENALAYLENVDSEIQTALALPAAQRQQRLRELSEELDIVGQPVRADDKKIITPTFSNRTQHRRSW